MKKLTTVILTFLTCGIVHALPVGNPLDPMIYTNHFFDWKNSCDPCSNWYDMFNVRLGFYGDYVFNRDLKTSVGTVQHVSMNTNAGLVVLNFCDWIEAFGTVGVTNFSSRTPAQLPTGRVSSNIQTEESFSPTMSYSGGARAVLWNCNCFYLGAEGQYFYSKSELNSFSELANGALTYFNNNSDRQASYSEWQVAITGSFLIEYEGLSYIPYAALQVAGISWNSSSMGGSGYSIPDADEAKLVGWTLGMAMVLNNLIGVSCEARFANEKALSVIGELSF